MLTGITFHIVDLGAPQGLTAASAVNLFLPMSGISTAVGLVGGLIADRMRVGTMRVERVRP